MRSVARHLRHRRVLWAVLVAASCSVYQPALLDEAAVGTAGESGGGTSGSGGSAAPTAGSNGGVEGGEAGMGTTSMAGNGASAEAGAAGDGTTGGSGGSGGTEPSGGTSAGGNSGGTGGTSAGGTSGTGGGSTVNVNLIDGFEDNDLTLERSDGRNGVWYLFQDGTTGKVGPSPLACTPLTGAPAALGTFAMNITASGFTSWGSGLGVDFLAGKKLYDAADAIGIRFWARVGGTNKRHFVRLVDVSTDKLGGKCNPAASAPNLQKCDDHFSKELTFTSQWTQYSVPFADLTQDGFGLPATLDPQQLYGLQVTAKAGLDVDLWLDEIEFYRAE